MQWEHLTSSQFSSAVDTCQGVGVVPIGVLEAHSSHLPLGQDMLAAHAIACLAAKQEPAIVLPPYAWGINHESAHLSGSMVLKRELVFSLLENVCEEMARHRLDKIILYSGHGGNRHFLGLFVQTLLEKSIDYAVYYADVPYFSERAKALLETEEYGHACEGETSVALYLHQAQVKMDSLPDAFTNRNRNRELTDAHLTSPVDWYAMYPTMYVGDASKASAEKGKIIVEDIVAGLVKSIQTVKQDTITRDLMNQFNLQQRHPKSPLDE